MKPKLNKVNDYTNVALRRDLITKIDKIVNDGLGYKSRGEFVKDAVRDLILKLREIKS